MAEEDLTGTDLTLLKEAFALFDVDHNGEISIEELAQIMARHHIHPSREELADMINRVDKNKNGSIDLEEFLEMMLAQSSSGLNNEKLDIEDIFKVFDQNGDGLISGEELKLTMRSLGETLTEDEVGLMLEEADIDGDGKIDLQEFTRLLSGLPQGPQVRQA